MLCVLFLYVRGGTYSLKSPPNDRFFEKLFMAKICLEEIAGEIFLYFILMSGLKLERLIDPIVQKKTVVKF